MREFEKGSHVVITGGAGYIGSCLAGELLHNAQFIVE